MSGSEIQNLTKNPVFRESDTVSRRTRMRCGIGSALAFVAGAIAIPFILLKSASQSMTQALSNDLSQTHPTGTPINDTNGTYALYQTHPTGTPINNTNGTHTTSIYNPVVFNEADLRGIVNNLASLNSTISDEEIPDQLATLNQFLNTNPLSETGKSVAKICLETIMELHESNNFNEELIANNTDLLTTFERCFPVEEEFPAEHQEPTQETMDEACDVTEAEALLRIAEPASGQHRTGEFRINRLLQRCAQVVGPVTGGEQFVCPAPDEADIRVELGEMYGCPSNISLSELEHTIFCAFSEAPEWNSEQYQYPPDTAAHHLDSMFKHGVSINGEFHSGNDIKQICGRIKSENNLQVPSSTPYGDVVREVFTQCES